MVRQDQRRPKRRGARPLSSSSEEDTEDDFDDRHQWQRRRNTKHPKVGVERDLNTAGTRIDESPAYYQANLGLCCKACYCSRERKQEYGGDDIKDRLVQMSHNSLWHRTCCHKIEAPVPTDWKDAYTKAEGDTTIDMLTADCAEGEIASSVDSSVLIRAYESGKRLESELYNEDTDQPDYHSLLSTNEEYLANQKNFHEMAKRFRNGVKSRATVLSMFSGIGADIVCLKRLGIDMKKIIHVEHDLVATHVYRSNHDPTYDEKLDSEGIEHLFFRTFEEFTGNLESNLGEIGPIDIVIGGPPCVDYATVNAWRQGVDGQQGQYMVQFGNLIKQLSRIMSPRPLFYLAENTAIGNKKDLPLDEGDLERIKAAFGVTWHLLFDSRTISPLRRKRTYFSNIPLCLRPEEYCDPAPDTCFHDGFKLPATIKEPGMIVKALGLMASQGRINDSRMKVYKRDAGKTYQRNISVTEREKLMGFKKGYVSNAVNNLFNELLSNGYGKNCLPDGMNWNKLLSKKFHVFAGDFHRCRGLNGSFRLEPGCPIKLKLAPPKTTKATCFYYSDGYSKRLIGNSFSIPTVEMLLRPLQEFFLRRDYPGFKYEYEWKIPVRGNSNINNVTTQAPTNPAGRKANWNEKASRIVTPSQSTESSNKSFSTSAALGSDVEDGEIFEACRGCRGDNGDGSSTFSSVTDDPYRDTRTHIEAVAASMSAARASSTKTRYEPKSLQFAEKPAAKKPRTRKFTEGDTGQPGPCRERTDLAATSSLLAATPQSPARVGKEPVDPAPAENSAAQSQSPLTANGGCTGQEVDESEDQGPTNEFVDPVDSVLEDNENSQSKGVNVMLGEKGPDESSAKKTQAVSKQPQESHGACVAYQGEGLDTTPKKPLSAESSLTLDSKSKSSYNVQSREAKQKPPKTESKCDPADDKNIIHGMKTESEGTPPKTKSNYDATQDADIAGSTKKDEMELEQPSRVKSEESIGFSHSGNVSREAKSATKDEDNIKPALQSISMEQTTNSTRDAKDEEESETGPSAVNSSDSKHSSRTSSDNDSGPGLRDVRQSAEGDESLDSAPSAADRDLIRQQEFESSRNYQTSSRQFMDIDI